MVLQSLAGLPAFLAYFCVSLVAVVLYLLVYTWITHHDEYRADPPQRCRAPPSRSA